MMAKSSLQILESAMREELIDPDGEPVTLRPLLGPACNQAEPGVDPDFAQLAARCSGFHLGSTEILLTERNVQDFRPLIRDWYELYGDGFGNFVCLETALTRAWGPVWFVCHDPPVILLVCRDLPTFLDFAIDRYRDTPVHPGNAFSKCHEHAMAIWKAGRRGSPAAGFAPTRDPVLDLFLTQVERGSVIMDFRGATPGFGFCWDNLDWTESVQICHQDPLLRASVRA